MNNVRSDRRKKERKNLNDELPLYFFFLLLAVARDNCLSRLADQYEINWITEKKEKDACTELDRMEDKA